MEFGHPIKRGKGALPRRAGLGVGIGRSSAKAPPPQGCLGSPTGGWKVLGFAGEKPQAPAREAAEAVQRLGGCGLPRKRCQTRGDSSSSPCSENDCLWVCHTDTLKQAAHARAVPTPDPVPAKSQHRVGSQVRPILSTFSNKVSVFI